MATITNINKTRFQNSFLLRENGEYVLRETGDKIVLVLATLAATIAKSATVTLTNLTKN